LKKPTTLQRVATVLIATLLLAVSATMAWATAYEYGERTLVPRGVTVNGTDLSGMTEAQVRAAITDAIQAPLTRPIAVAADGKSFEFDPSGVVAVDVDAMVAEAFAPRRNASFVMRVRHDLTNEPMPAEVEPVYSVDTSAVADWLNGVAAKVNRKPIDAELAVEESKVVISASKTGRKADTAEALALMESTFQGEQALAGGERAVTVPVATLKPKVTEDSFGKTIVVDLSQRRIRLFDGATVEKSYPCAIGTPQFPTPKGEFEIVAKRFRPTWVNPGSDWAKDMPKSIPPGPGNPLGTRALNLSASGIRFHGTENIGSVGTAASHGCMRMYRRDIEDFYERVEIGTKVYIVP